MSESDDDGPVVRSDDDGAGGDLGASHVRHWSCFCRRGTPLWCGAFMASAGAASPFRKVLLITCGLCWCGYRRGREQAPTLKLGKGCRPRAAPQAREGDAAERACERAVTRENEGMETCSVMRSFLPIWCRPFHLHEGSRSKCHGLTGAVRYPSRVRRAESGLDWSACCRVGAP